MIDFTTYFFAIYILDVVSKALVRHFLALGTEIKLLPVFSLVHVQNTGAAFGMFQDKNMFFVVIGLLLSVALIWMAYQSRKTDKALTVIFGIVLAGALGNLTDRLVFGRVTDFLDFYVGTHHWPAFNVADSAICIGAGLLLLQNFKRKA